jgi:hypothetical protein
VLYQFAWEHPFVEPFAKELVIEAQGFVMWVLAPIIFLDNT